MSSTQSDAPVGLTARQQSFIDGLRELADFLEANPAIPATFGLTATANFNTYDDGETPREKLSRVIRSAGGRWEKKADEQDFDLIRYFGPHKLICFADRAAVCERVVVGSETVTREVPDPELLAQVPVVTVTEEVERVEWVCPPALLASEDDR